MAAITKPQIPAAAKPYVEDSTTQESDDSWEDTAVKCLSTFRKETLRYTCDLDLTLANLDNYHTVQITARNIIVPEDVVVQADAVIEMTAQENFLQLGTLKAKKFIITAKKPYLIGPLLDLPASLSLSGYTIFPVYKLTGKNASEIRRILRDHSGYLLSTG